MLFYSHIKEKVTLILCCLWRSLIPKRLYYARCQTICKPAVHWYSSPASSKEVFVAANSWQGGLILLIKIYVTVPDRLLTLSAKAFLFIILCRCRFRCVGGGAGVWRSEDILAIFLRCHSDLPFWEGLYVYVFCIYGYFVCMYVGIPEKSIGSHSRQISGAM